MTALSAQSQMVWIKGSDDHTDELIRRFDKDPKPMAYQPAFLETAWAGYLAQNDLNETEVDPDAFIRWTYAKALAHRQPLYQSMADNWGITVEASDMATVRDAKDFTAIIGSGIAKTG